MGIGIRDGNRNRNRRWESESEIGDALSTKKSEERSFELVITNFHSGKIMS